jgi:splicing factor 3B subunit 2
VDQLGENDRLDKEALRREYESRQRAEAAGQWQSIDQDDLADMIASESRKRAKHEDKRSRR